MGYETEFVWAWGNSSGPILIKLLDLYFEIWRETPVSHHLFCGWTESGKTVSCHAYEFVDLRVHKPSRSKELYPNVFLDRVQAAGFSRVMAMEALAVHPSVRGQTVESLGSSFAELTIQYGLKLAQSIAGLDAVIACTRDSRSVNQMAVRSGFSDTGIKTNVRGESSSLMIHQLNQDASMCHQAFQSPTGWIWDQLSTYKYKPDNRSSYEIRY